jgi:hypothetical protein
MKTKIYLFDKLELGECMIVSAKDKDWKKLIRSIRTCAARYDGRFKCKRDGDNIRVIRIQ